MLTRPGPTGATGVTPYTTFLAISATIVALVLSAGGADVVLVEGADLAERATDAIGDASLELILDAAAGEPVAQLASLLKIGGQIISYTARARQPLSIPVVELIVKVRPKGSTTRGLTRPGSGQREAK